MPQSQPGPGCQKFVSPCCPLALLHAGLGYTVPVSKAGYMHCECSVSCLPDPHLSRVPKMPTLWMTACKLWVWVTVSHPAPWQQYALRLPRIVLARSRFSASNRRYVALWICIYPYPFQLSFFSHCPASYSRCWPLCITYLHSSARVAWGSALAMCNTCQIPTFLSFQPGPWDARP